MDSWILIAALAYLLTGVAFVIDKYLLALPIPKPFTYAFWVAMLSTPVVFLIPFFDIYIPNPTYFAVSFLSGTAFFTGLIFLYKSIRESDVSVASTQVGVNTSIFTYIFSFLILREVLPLHNTLALVLLISGMLLLGRAGKSIVWHAIAAGTLLAISFVLLKWTFNNGDFVNGLFWTRIGFIGSALLAIIPKKTRHEVGDLSRKAPIKSKVVFVINKIIAASAFVLLYYALLLGNVTVINALLGIQFLFVFLIALAIRKKFPTIGENIERKVLITKSLGMVLVLAGFLSVLI